MSNLKRGRVNWTLLVASAAGITLLASGGSSHAQSLGQLANPSVRLWYEGTGRLSDNIAPPRDFALWNAIIGEGTAEENANDALFTVEIHANGEQNIATPLTMTATNSKGKILGQRIFSGFLTSHDGKVVAPLWIRNVGCAGRVNFSARFGRQKESVTLNFDCGE